MAPQAGEHRMSIIVGCDRVFEAFPFIRPGEEFSPTLGLQAQRHIASNLRAMYDSLVREPLPEQFLDLLAQLDQNDPGKE